MKQAYPDVTFHSIIIRFAVGAGLSRHLSFNFQFFLTVATWREYNLVDKESSPAKCFFAQKYIKFNTWNTTCLGNILRTNAKIRRNRKLIAVPGVWCPFMLHAYGCVFCSVTLVSVYTCVGMPLRFKSIVRVPSSQALPGSLITAHHLCAFLMYLARWLCGSIPKKKMGNTQSLFPLLPGAHLPSGTCASDLSRRTQETASDCRVRRLFFFFPKFSGGHVFFWWWQWVNGHSCRSEDVSRRIKHKISPISFRAHDPRCHRIHEPKLYECKQNLALIFRAKFQSRQWSSLSRILPLLLVDNMRTELDAHHLLSLVIPLGCLF